MSTLLRRREMMLSQEEEILPYVPLNKIKWLKDGAYAVTAPIPTRNGAVIHDDKGYMQICNENGERVERYTKNYTAMPEVVGSSFSIWYFKKASEMTVEYMESVNFSINYL